MQELDYSGVPEPYIFTREDPVPFSMAPQLFRGELKVNDPVEHPSHYTNHPSGIECIDVTEHMGFCVGNAVKYLWRAGLKGNQIEDLKKSLWYIEREIARLEKLEQDAASKRFE